jgi:hypothetical protein
VLDKRQARPELATVLSILAATAEFGGRLFRARVLSRLTRGIAASSDSCASCGTVVVAAS